MNEKGLILLRPESQTISINTKYLTGVHRNRQTYFLCRREAVVPQCAERTAFPAVRVSEKDQFHRLPIGQKSRVKTKRAACSHSERKSRQGRGLRLLVGAARFCWGTWGGEATCPVHYYCYIFLSPHGKGRKDFARVLEARYRYTTANPGFHSTDTVSEEEFLIKR